MVASSVRWEVGIERRQEIRSLVKEHALLRGKYDLSDGQRSNYYWDGKMATTFPRAARLIAEEIFDLLKDTDIQAVGGVAIGGDLMVPAVALISEREGKPIPGFVVRDSRKEHGTKKMIEGQFPKERAAKVALIDDVITTGNSISKAIEIIESEGCKVAKIVVLLDRQEGGSDRLKKAGRDFTAILQSDASGEITIDEPSAVAGHAEEGAIPR